MASVESCCFHGYVGVDPIANELKSVVYPTLSNKEKKNMRYQEKLLRPTIFNLGVGLIESDPEKATGLLLQRELPQVYDAAKKPHEAIFLPHKFVFPKGVAAKAIVKSSGRHVLNSESQKIVSKFDPTLEGSQEEENIYNKFKATIKEHDKNIVVINGWKDNGSEKREQREYDFLIISEPYKTIIHIEAKTAMTKGSIGKAGLQLKSGLDFFQTVIPLPALQNWQYIRVMAFAKQASFTPCKDCELFVLGPDTNIETWWKNLKESQMVNSSERDPITYENIMKYLLHLMFRQNDPITETALLDHTIETTDEMTAFFWSSIQYSILKEPDNKRVALISPFGTGKTSLLKEKAKMLSKDGKRVTYIILSDTAETLLKCQVEEELKMIRNIKVLCKTIKELHTEKHFIELVQDYPDTNFFLDEVLVGYGGIDPDVLNKFAELVDTKHHIWFACQNQQPPHPSVLQAYLTPEMNVPLRYSKNLLETCQKHSEEIGGTSWTSDYDPKILLNTGNLSLFLALTRNTSLGTAVTQLAHILKHEVTETIIKIELDEVEKGEVIQALKSSSISERLIFEGEISNFIKNKEKILVITSTGDSTLKGFEVPILVVFSFFLPGSLNENIFSRCKSKLIIVCDEEHARKIIPSNKESEYGNIITVHDTLMPREFEEAVKSDNCMEIKRFLNRRRPIPVDIRNEASQTGLMIACSSKSSKAAEMIVNNKKDRPDLEAVDSQGWTALHYASSSGSIGCLESLINKGASVTATTNNGETAVHLASEKGHLETLKFLIQHNYTINKKTSIPHPTYRWQKITKTALHLATSNKHDKIVECLLLNKADVNIKNEETNTALHMAAEVGSVEITKMLLDYRGNIEEKGDDKRTPLHFAAKNGNLDVVKYLCEKGSDIDAKDNYPKMTPLHFAAEKGNLDIVKYLCEKGSDIEAKAYHGRTPLHFAAEKGNLDVVKYLCEKGSDIEARDYGKRTPLHLAAENGNLDVVKYLCEKGSDVEAKDDDEWTPLHFAALRDNLDVVKYLCEKGCDIEAKDEDRMTPLHLAAEKGNLDVVKYLCEKGSDNEAKTDDDFTTLMHAVEGHQYGENQNQLQTVKYLVDEEKANLSAKDKEGKSVLMHAVRGYAEDVVQVVKYLVEEQKANLTDKDNKGKTVVMHAVKSYNENKLQVVKYLVEEQKANLMDKDKEGKTCLDHAIDPYVKKYLKTKGVSAKLSLDEIKGDDTKEYLKTKVVKKTRKNKCQTS